MSEALAPSPAAGTPLRLRASVHVRTLEHRGVAVSAGHQAVVLDGQAAEHLWHALEPTLRVGVRLEDLLESVPPQARRATETLWRELEEHRLICALGAAPEGLLGEHFERTARDPGRAGDRAATAEVTCAGNPELVTQLHAALADTGLPLRPGGWPATGPDTWLGAHRAAIVTLVLPQERHRVLLTGAGGWRLVGADPADAASRRAVRGWLDAREASGVVPLPERDEISDHLAAAQAVLAVLSLLADGTPPGPPTYHVTTPDVVSETHPLLVLPDPGPADHPVDLQDLLDAIPATASLDDALRQAEPLWNGPLSPWRGPVPADLPQLPVGLATAGSGDVEVIGVGLDTADARASCLEQLAGLGSDLAVGRDALAAASRAIHADAWSRARWADPDRTEPGSALARRLMHGLTLRAGVPAQVRSGPAVEPAGLTRAEVVDEGGAVLGTGIAPDQENAVEEALLAALATVLLAQHDLVLDPAPVPRLGSTQRSWAAWASRTGITVLAPEVPQVWGELGLHACAVARTEP